VFLPQVGLPTDRDRSASRADIRRSAGAESEPPFTTDEVAALLNVPLNTIYKWHKEGTGPPGYQTHKESQYRRSDVVRWLAEQGFTLAVCQSECGRTYTRTAFKAMPGP
jgi:excisionase family DNA binding protein